MGWTYFIFFTKYKYSFKEIINIRCFFSLKKQKKKKTEAVFTTIPNISFWRRRREGSGHIPVKPEREVTLVVRDINVFNLG